MKRLKEELAAMAAALATARGDESAAKLPGANAAEANAGDSAGAGDGEPAAKKQRTD